MRKLTEMEKIRVLVVDGFSNHDWRQTTELTKKILEDSGICIVDVSTAPPTKKSPGWKDWRPRFADYDVIIQNCNNLGRHTTWPTAVKRDLEKFVGGGGGLYILHSANNSFSRWKEYNRMIGLGWRNKRFGKAIIISDDGKTTVIPAGKGGNTGHGKRNDVVLTRIGDHPIHKNFPLRWKVADLEVYRYARGPAENLTVLSFAKEKTTGLNFPIEWVVNYGKGRVYNSTFGHVWKGSVNPPAMRCVAFQTSLIRAMQWLCGRETSWVIPKDFPDAENIRLKKL